MEKPKVRISVRNLVEFILRSGDLDNSSGSSGDKEAMLKGGRLHRKIQRSMKGRLSGRSFSEKESEYRRCGHSGRRPRRWDLYRGRGRLD